MSNDIHQMIVNMYNWTDEQVEKYVQKCTDNGALMITILGPGPCMWTPSGMDVMTHTSIILEMVLRIAIEKARNKE